MKPALVFRSLVLGLAVGGFFSYSSARADDPPVAAAKPQTPSSIPQGPSPAQTIAWGDPAHKAFFNYQDYLIKNGLKGATPASWKALDAGGQAAAVAKGENELDRWLKDFLNRRLEGSKSGVGHYTSPNDEEFIRAVWGDDMLKKVSSLDAALTTKSPDQIRLALDGVAGLARQLGARDVDWRSVFDGGSGQGSAAGAVVPNFLAVKHQMPFLAALQSKEVQQVLATPGAFVQFLDHHGVPAAAIPSLTAAYEVLRGKPDPGASREAVRRQAQLQQELAHILPTIVQFVKDGHRIVLDDDPKNAHAYGFAASGHYDSPSFMALTAKGLSADPVLAGAVLAHEFEHVYDMYIGRYNSLDTELRGFAADAKYMQAVESGHPAKYQELRDSRDPTTRELIQDGRDSVAAMAKSPADFADQIAYGHGYGIWIEGVFSGPQGFGGGRASVREALDPNFGLPRQAAALRRFQDEARAKVEGLEQRQQKLEAQINQRRTRELDQQYQIVADDLTAARREASNIAQGLAYTEVRLARLRSEAQWMGPDAQYDLRLQVDDKYYVDK